LLHRGQWLAGTIRCREETAYRSIWIGWKDGDPGILRSEVVTALYMETIERAYEHGKRRVLLGGTLPYLEDGVFAFKARWTARIDPNMNVYQRMAWYLDPTHPQVRRFLERRSIVACGHNGRIVVYSAQAPKTGQTYRETLRSISAWYRLRETPGSSSDSTHLDVPSALRPWFEPCLPSSSPVSSVL
jgi:hypothetical protein